MIEIFEGPRAKVISIDFVGNHFATSAQLRTQISARHPTIGHVSNYHSETLDEDRQNLIDYYHANGFFEVKVSSVARPGANPGRVDLTFVVSEGTQYKCAT